MSQNRQRIVLGAVDRKVATVQPMRGKIFMLSSGERPAFPVPSSHAQPGISIRDWMATMALQGVVSKGLDVIGDRVVSETDRYLMMARRAYAIADAMLIVSEEHAAVGSGR